MNDKNANYLIQCPFCGAKTPSPAAFCHKCGRDFNTGVVIQPASVNTQYPPPPPPPPMPASYPQPQGGRSHRSRNLIVAAVAVILIVSLVSAAVLLMPQDNNGNHNTPTPTSHPTPTRNPTASPTSRPTLTPMPTPQPLNSTITAMNIQFVYQGTDQGYFGPSSQSFTFTNQPNGLLSIYQGSTFWYSFKLTAGSSAAPDSIVSITVDTPGFSLVSVTPDLPISFTAGSSTTITVRIQSPEALFDGPVTLVITTSG